MNIQDWLLTETEVDQAWLGVELMDDFKLVAEAQLAKALWGVVDWLGRPGMERMWVSSASNTLQLLLEQADLSRPGGVSDE